MKNTSHFRTVRDFVTKEVYRNNNFCSKCGRPTPDHRDDCAGIAALVALDKIEDELRDAREVARKPGVTDREREGLA